MSAEDVFVHYYNPFHCRGCKKEIGVDETEIFGTWPNKTPEEMKLINPGELFIIECEYCNHRQVLSFEHPKVRYHNSTKFNSVGEEEDAEDEG